MYLCCYTPMKQQTTMDPNPPTPRISCNRCMKIIRRKESSYNQGNDFHLCSMCYMMSYKEKSTVLVNV
jgi:late competence protein required for DNA uptake (superfamily II DNA/RNA helicase)